MPTYEYACTECGKQLEVVQSFADDALTECPSCGGRLRKLFGNVGVVFKGSGFYRNDSKSDAKKSASSSPSSTEGSAKAASKSDGSSAPADSAKTNESAPSKSEKKSVDKAVSTKDSA